ncbi:sulfite exporter TauE/SafE family protein [Neptuniibacter sp.]|uniref:sulfite exporter TauE/SafE family protein n=1 Tax=Neptuniibacter sp. TaxID=1962643 RepID=UPI0026049128|nr:sulfite exporter TauE/SafE family protein [Neptuniibacter sp.]MCP4598078.1 sulfite exporter TauE/SafE family protein [Neptuniibacter sp.]
MLTDPIFYLAAIPAVLIVGISKGGFGGGLGFIAVPMIALSAPPIVAAAIMLPILCLMDLVGLLRFKGHVDKQNLLLLIPAAGIGIILGAFSFKYLNDAQIKLMIGTIALTFVAYSVLKRQAEARQPSTIRGYFWGTIAGFTSFGVHAGGPPLNIYLLPLKLHKSTYAATTIVFFAAINYMKLIPYTWLGQFTQETLLAALVLAPLAPVGVYIGTILHHKISDLWFYRACYFFLVLTGSKLVYDALIEMNLI